MTATEFGGATRLVSALGLVGVFAVIGCNSSSTATNQDAKVGPVTAAGSGNATMPPIANSIPDQQESVGDSTEFAAGKSVFESNGCGRCHSRGGAGGPAGRSGPMAGGPGGPPQGGGPPGLGGKRGFARGPDLSKVGADSAHTVEWLTEYVRNPKSQKPDSRMPPFDGKISGDDLKSLAEYLASLK